MVRVGSARSNENGGINGGKPGDQKSGREVSTQDWYLHSKGWVVIRAKDRQVRELIAHNMESICANNNIGYCQDHRTSLIAIAAGYGYDASKVLSPCETDCSEAVRVCCLYAEVKVAENQSAGIILAAWEKALKECMGKAAGKTIRGIGVAIPSPFDFVQGIAMADHKFASLKGLNIRQELSRVTGILPSSILFTNDAAAFGMGAWRLNGSRDRHLIGVTLGTGFGACFIVDGCYATYGPGVPIGGELWNYPFRGVIAEDYVSTRWFEKRFAELTGEAIQGVKGMIDLYQAGKYKTETEQVFREFSNSFGEIMVPFMTRFNADMLVIGGGMVLSEQYFLPLISQYMKANGINASIMTVADTTTAIIAGAAALCDLI